MRLQTTVSSRPVTPRVAKFLRGGDLGRRRRFGENAGEPADETLAFENLPIVQRNCRAPFGTGYLPGSAG